MSSRRWFDLQSEYVGSNDTTLLELKAQRLRLHHIPAVEEGGVIGDTLILPLGADLTHRGRR